MDTGVETARLSGAADALTALAIVLEEPERLVVSQVDLTPPGDTDVVVDIDWSGISTGTERLLWTGRMPPFPGMGYPLVPGYESVGRVQAAGKQAGRQVGERVFVPGARCFGAVRGLFGGAASRVVVPGARVVPVPDALGERAVLLALAATAYHAAIDGQQPPNSSSGTVCSDACSRGLRLLRAPRRRSCGSGIPSVPVAQSGIRC